MSKTVHITTSTQFQNLISSHLYVVVDFYADWCGPCKAIAPIFEQLVPHSKPGKLTFAKVNVDTQQSIARCYSITAVPTFLIFHNGRVSNTIRGASAPALQSAVLKIVTDLPKEPIKQKQFSKIDGNTREKKSDTSEATVSGGYAMSCGTNWRTIL